MKKRGTSKPIRRKRYTRRMKRLADCSLSFRSSGMRRSSRRNKRISRKSIYSSKSISWRKSMLQFRRRLLRKRRSLNWKDKTGSSGNNSRFTTQIHLEEEKRRRRRSIMKTSQRNSQCLRRRRRTPLSSRFNWKRWNKPMKCRDSRV